MAAGVAMTKINYGFEEGLKGREFAEYKCILSGGGTAFSLDGVTTTSSNEEDAGWGLVTRISVVPTADPTALEYYFDGTTVQVKGLAANDTCYLYVAGDRY